MTHPCPIPACIVTDLASDRLLCPTHWRQVLAPLRDEVNRTWRAVMTSKNPTLTLERMKAYRVAKARAIEAVGGEIAT